MKKNSFYFTHDMNARSDEKIKLLLMKWGMAGYGVYWAIVEDLYQNANALQTHTERIAYDLRVDENMVKSILHDFNLFVFNGDYFGSASIERRMNERIAKSEKARESAGYRWDKMRTHDTEDANALRPECDSNPIKEKKGKEKKKKEINNISNNDNVGLVKLDFEIETVEHELVEFIKQECPRVAKMKKPMDSNQASVLCTEFGFDAVKEVILAMENWEPLHKKSVNANLTCRNWLNRRTKNDQLSKISTGQSNSPTGNPYLDWAARQADNPFLSGDPNQRIKF